MTMILVCQINNRSSAGLAEHDGAKQETKAQEEQHQQQEQRQGAMNPTSCRSLNPKP